MSGELGRASYELDADLEPLRRNVKQSRAEVSDFERVLDSLTAIADIAAEQLKQVKITSRQGEESRASATSILEGVSGIKEESRAAARELDNVRITDRQAAESDVAGDVIDRKLKDITGNANEARRSLESVRLAGIGAGGASGGVYDSAAGRFRGDGGRFVPGGGGADGGNGRNGAGIGPFGSGFGRIGLLGAAIGGGTVLGPSAGPALVGLLGAIPALAATGVGAVGALALAFDGVGKAIGGDKKAFDALVPSQQAFVQSVRSLSGWLDKLKETAASNMFPGLTDALHSALSPGTLSAITTAVAEFARAIGNAGAVWGKYFGSSEFQSIFGPLMQAGARNLGSMSDAALHLFDAMGVLARAAIPFTQWIVDGITAGSKWADAFLHAKDATGALGGAMSEAETSLRLVGNLLVSLGRAVVDLGDALYPVSKVAVKDLTDGFNALAGIISRNKDAIREIVGTALTGLVTAVKLVVDGLRLLNDGLQHVIGNKAAIVTAIVAIGGALTIAMGPQSAAIVGVVLAIGLIKKHWQEISDWVLVGADKLTLAILEPFSHLPGSLGEWARKAKDQVEAELGSAKVDLAMIGSANGNAYGEAMANAIASSMQKVSTKLPSFTPSSYGQSYVPGSSPLKDMAAAAAKKAGIPVDTFLAQINQESGFNPAAVSSAGALGIAQFMPATANGYGINPLNPSEALPAAAKMMAGLLAKYHGNMGLALAAYNAGSGTVDKYLAGKGDLPSETQNYIRSIMGSKAAIPTVDSSIYATSTSGAWGTDPAFTKNLGPKPPKPPVIPNMITDLLNKASANASSSKQLGNVGGTAKRYLENELGDLTAADAALHKLVPKTAREKQQVSAKETQVENKIRDVNTLIKNAIFATGDAILPAALKTKLTALQTKFKADSTYAATLTGQAAEAYAATLRDDITGQESVLTSEASVLKQKLATATGKQKAAIQKELTKVDGQLQTVQEQVVQTLQSAVQTLQQHVATDFSKVQGQLLTALGNKYFQNGLLTPLEQQLSDMTAADTSTGLTDTLAAAQKQYADDLAAAADTATLAADQTAEAQAQRAIDENDLAIRAAAEREKANADYATASQSLTDKLDTLSDAFQNGTGTIADLTALAAEFGIQIDAQNTPALADLSTETDNLKAAFKDLADYIEKITGTRPDTGTDASSIAPGPGYTAAGPELVPSTGGGASDALSRYLANRGVIGMADGGIGRVTMPTLFYSAGDEDFAFSGEGSSFGSVGTQSRDLPTIEVPVNIDGREVARAVKPHTERIITIGH